jgi:hypothetical protein
MAVLSNIRQRSALMIAVIAFALFAFIIAIYSVVVALVHQKM